MKFKAGSLKLMKEMNKNLILRTLIENGKLSRAEITAKVNLSASTVSSLVSELIEDEIIEENSIGESSGGRKPIYLTIKGNSSYIFIISLNSNDITLRVHDMNLNEVYHSSLSKKIIYGNGLFAIISGGMEKAMNKLNIQREKAAGIGILIDESLYAANFNMLFSTYVFQENFSIQEALEYTFKIPVISEYSGRVDIEKQVEKLLREIPENYTYISFDEKITTSIYTNGKAFERNGERVIDIGKLLISPNVDIEKLLSPSNFYRKIYHCLGIEKTYDTEEKNTSFILENWEKVWKGEIESSHKVKEHIYEAADCITLIMKNLLLFFKIDVFILGGTLMNVPGFDNIVKNQFGKVFSDTKEIIIKSIPKVEKDNTLALVEKVRDRYFNDFSNRVLD
ncbi:AsnC family protein [Desnuesiella massiliensis]|uniref:AsnC family protein n=1 Tax=Desnuesiella massiliensis TaxID=1650662 RepID=UPI0006E2A6F6|nr:AsnC family protein [Desnuesiella massiliensis]